MSKARDEWIDDKCKELYQTGITITDTEKYIMRISWDACEEKYLPAIKLLLEVKRMWEDHKKDFSIGDWNAWLENNMDKINKLEEYEKN